MMTARSAQHAKNFRLSLILFGTFVALFAGSVIYITLYH
jgi:hypothetical protein